MRKLKYTKFITIRLSDREYNEVEELQNKANINNRSQLIRTSLKLYENCLNTAPELISKIEK